MKRLEFIFKIKLKPLSFNALRFSNKKKNKDKSINKMHSYHLLTYPRPKKARLLNNKFKSIDQESSPAVRQLSINLLHKGLKDNLEPLLSFQKRRIFCWLKTSSQKNKKTRNQMPCSKIQIAISFRCGESTFVSRQETHVL